MRIEERAELLAAVYPGLGVVDVQQDAPRHRFEAVAEQLDHCRHHALSAVALGRFSSRLIVGCEHRSSPLSGNRPISQHLEGGVGF